MFLEYILYSVFIYFLFRKLKVRWLNVKCLFEKKIYILFLGSEELDYFF